MKGCTSIAILAGLVLTLAGCSSLINKEEFQTEDDPYSVSKAYYEKFEDMDALKNGRSVENQSIPSFIYEIELEDINGNKINISDLSESEQEKFYNAWKENNIKQLQTKLENDENLRNALMIENEAYYKTKEESERTVKSNFSEEEFIKKYQKNLSRLQTNSSKSTSREVDSSKKITKDCIVPASAAALKSIYTKGLILVCPDTTSSSASSFVGHSSMTYFDGWNDEWERNGTEPMAITSYPKDTNSMWDGKTDGVQLEPAGMWIGNSGGSSDNVSIYKVRSVQWIWDWFNVYTVYTDAPADDYSKAVNYSKSQLGKPYNWTFLKDVDIAFYCSSLVYKSWYQISSAYDMSFGIFVTPSDIAASDKTVLITNLKNK